MYDGLYRLIDDDVRRGAVEVVVHADHLKLNDAVAELLGAGARLDLISTHGKYAPSQAPWLRPLDDLVPAAHVDAQAPGAVALCRGLQGELLCVPRNVDVRVLWRRVDLVPESPDTWDDVVALVGKGQRFGMPGRGSGLVGTFYELVLGRDARLLDGGGGLVLTESDAAGALEVLRSLVGGGGGGGGRAVEHWHYDEVDAALAGGGVAMAASWPGATAALRSGTMGAQLRPGPYPAGPTRRVTYSGCHGWAIPRTCADVDAAVDLLVRLSGEEAGRIEASSGAVTAHRAAAESVVPVDEVDAERLRLVAEAIAGQMATYPPLPWFEGFEAAAADAIADAVFRSVSASELVDRLRRAVPSTGGRPA